MGKWWCAAGSTFRGWCTFYWRVRGGFRIVGEGGLHRIIPCLMRLVYFCLRGRIKGHDQGPPVPPRNSRGYKSLRPYKPQLRSAWRHTKSSKRYLCAKHFSTMAATCSNVVFRRGRQLTNVGFVESYLHVFREASGVFGVHPTNRALTPQEPFVRLHVASRIFSRDWRAGPQLDNT